MIHPVLIAGRALAVMGPYCITKSIEDNVIHRLKSLMWDINYSTDRPNILFNVPIVLRVKAADLLDELEWLPEDLFELIFITDFSESNASPQARKKEFWIGKYPVTNIQYERFLNADDFLDPVLWKGFPKYDENSQELKDDWGTAGWMWVNDPVLGKVDMNGRIFPRFWDDIMFGITHRVVPVIGITWFEANAYCRWVQRHWEELEESRSKKGFNRPIVRLPTELEWEFTAGKTGTGNSFPWDSSNTSSTSQEVPHRANVREGGVNRTTPVGMYPLGKSYPHGVWEMAGNVWEWQANYFDSRRDTIAIRGGSWYDSLNRSRRSSRNHSYPHNLWDGLGFRILARNS
jgi:formylglycine-generating enzyme required for sulfatase activity